MTPVTGPASCETVTVELKTFRAKTGTNAGLAWRFVVAAGG